MQLSNWKPTDSSTRTNGFSNIKYIKGQNRENREKRVIASNFILKIKAALKDVYFKSQSMLCSSHAKALKNVAIPRVSRCSDAVIHTVGTKIKKISYFGQFFHWLIKKQKTEISGNAYLKTQIPGSFLRIWIMKGWFKRQENKPNKCFHLMV